MNKQIIALVVGIVVLVVAYVAHSFVLANDCQKPSGNTKLCYDPDDRVGTCEGISWTFCAVVKTSFLYEINKFPDGTTSSNSGLTTEEGADCWRWMGCVWKGASNNGHCEASGTWSPWKQKNKIVKDPDGVCPEG